MLLRPGTSLHLAEMGLLISVGHHATYLPGQVRTHIQTSLATAWPTLAHTDWDRGQDKRPWVEEGGRVGGTQEKWQQLPLPKPGSYLQDVSRKEMFTSQWVWTLLGEKRGSVAPLLAQRQQRGVGLTLNIPPARSQGSHEGGTSCPVQPGGSFH